MAKNDSEKMTWMKMSKGFPAQYKLRALVNRKGKGRGLNGREMFAIAMFMILESISHHGKLRYSETKPYTPELLADVLCFSRRDVELTLEALVELGILKIEDDGTMVFECVEDNIIEDTISANRMRVRRKTLKENNMPAIDEKRYGGNGLKTLMRAGFKCELCGGTKNLVIHHNNGYSCSMDDLVVLCRKCHGIAHSSNHKGHIDVSIKAQVHAD